MTSNQLQFQSNLELGRHNQVTEAETERHNKATETIQNDANVINTERNRIQESYNSRMLDLQDEYNKWYSRFTEANEKEKRKIDAELNRIKAEMNDITESHNVRMEEISAQEADIKERTLNENARHNTFMEAQSLATVSSEWWFREKQLDYQERQLDETRTWHTGMLTNESQKEWHDWLINQERNQISWNQNRIHLADVEVKQLSTLIDWWDVRKKAALQENSQLIDAINTGIHAADTVFRGVGNLFKLVP